MLSFQDLFDLCTLSYEDLGNQRLIYRFSKPLTLEHAQVHGDFAAYELRAPDLGGWNAIVFRGRKDWRGFLGGLPGTLGQGPTPLPEYERGLDYVTQRGRGKILVGHSLGGGIAAYVAATLGLPAATIYPAPLRAAWLGSGYLAGPHPSTNITNYVCHAEALTQRGDHNETGHVRYGNDVWIESRGDSSTNKHALDQIVLDPHGIVPHAA